MPVTDFAGPGYRGVPSSETWREVLRKDSSLVVVVAMNSARRNKHECVPRLRSWLYNPLSFFQVFCFSLCPVRSSLFSLRGGAAEESEKKKSPLFCSFPMFGAAKKDLVRV